jgi:transcriptional regulator with XRE-family HTH domain
MVPCAAASNSLQGIASEQSSRQDRAMTRSDRSGDFASELRRWRKSRRLSQLELATRAGTTQRHLAFIEGGRSKPGRSMVVRLAESLGLSLRDRNRLLLAAGYAPLFPETALDAPALSAVMNALGTILEGHMSYPAVVVRPYGELVAANKAFDFVKSGAAPALLQPPINVLRLALHPQGVARRVVNLAEWGRHITENLRAHAQRSPDPRLDALIRELEGYVPPLELADNHLGFAVPLRLRTENGELSLLTTLTSFATAVDVALAELRLEAFLPANEATAEFLRKLQAD